MRDFRVIVDGVLVRERLSVSGKYDVANVLYPDDNDEQRGFASIGRILEDSDDAFTVQLIDGKVVRAEHL